MVVAQFVSEKHAMQSAKYVTKFRLRVWVVTGVV